MRSHLGWLWVLAAWLPCSFSCGGTEASTASDGGNTTAESGPRVEGGVGEAGARDSSSACSVGQPGSPFTFHVHNAGTRPLGLGYGCGADQPITLDTQYGPQGIGAESANTCGFTCEQDYMGNIQSGCSDCGPGVGAALPVGSTVDIAWDRRVYMMSFADPACVGGQQNLSCALAVTVAPTATQKGTITLCTMGSSSGGPGNTNCYGDDPVTFTADTTGSAATLDVK